MHQQQKRPVAVLTHLLVYFAAATKFEKGYPKTLGNSPPYAPVTKITADTHNTDSRHYTTYKQKCNLPYSILTQSFGSSFQRG